MSINRTMLMNRIKQFMERAKTIKASVKLAFMVLVVALLAWQLVGRKASVTETMTTDGSAFKMVDSLNDKPVRVSVDGDVDRFEVREMPVFALLLPDINLLSDETAQRVAHALGFTNKSQVMNSGDLVGYKEDVKTLTFDRKLGQVNYSTVLSIANQAVLKREIGESDAEQVVRKFFNDTGLPAAFFDLDNLQYEPVSMDSSGALSPAIFSKAELIKVVIPYQVSGVRIILPVESYMVIDGEGIVRLMTLFFPNIALTDDVYTLRSWSSAKRVAEAGGAAVIDYGASATEQFNIEKSYAAYYINQREFYSLDKRRILKPVYVFEGSDGTLVVNANKD